MRFLLLSTTFYTVSLCCQLKDFLPCVMQLTAQKVDFNMNPVEVIFNITTEAKLMHTCRTYGRIFPCFDQKMIQCGTSAEKLQLERGKRLHSYLCAPFSLQRQKIFLRRSKCIQEVLAEPQTAICNRDSSSFVDKLQSCRDMCKTTDCLTKIELSEVATCTYLKIGQKCTTEAAQFFGQMQQVLTNKEYPMQCQYDLSPKPDSELKKGIPLESLVAQTTSSTTYVTVHPPELPSVIDGVVTKTSLPIMRRTDPNSKFKPRPTASLSTGPVIKTVLVDERGAPVIPTTTQAPKVIHKFLPNPYTTRNPTVLKNDNIRTTRTIIPADGKPGHTYVPWNYNKEVQVSTLSSALAPLKPTESVISAPPVAFNFKIPKEETSTQPFRVEINWMDDGTKEDSTKAPGQYFSPWYLKTPSYIPPENQITVTAPSSPMEALEAVNPLLNHIKSQSLNFTEIGNQANNYFSAALSAFAETKKEMAHNDPWRTLIDAVAPTIHKFSPDVIPRIREEINRIQPQDQQKKQ